MREFSFDGYIDEDVWFGDEITPQLIRDTLYGVNGDQTDDVHITLNSYGGSCNAATRIYDLIRTYAGQVYITISGTAASAATVVAMAANHLEMTPGSLFMIHDPILFVGGNEHDMSEAIRELQAYKESILNVYETRCKTNRETVAQMMTDTTWMDAKDAVERGFVDAVSQRTGGAQNRVNNRAHAENMVRVWLDRHGMASKGEKTKSAQANAKESDDSMVNARMLRLRLLGLDMRKDEENDHSGIDEQTSQGME